MFARFRHIRSYVRVHSNEIFCRVAIHSFPFFEGADSVSPRMELTV